MDKTDWHDGNNRYLEKALEWLRLRLLAIESPAAASEPPRAEHRPVVSATTGTRADLERAAVEMKAAEKIAPPPALSAVAKRLSLSLFESQVLLLCAAMELDTRFPALCARAHDNLQQPYPTLALALAVLDEPAWDSRDPRRPLRNWHLIEIVGQYAYQPLNLSPLRADVRIVDYLKGLNYLDDRLVPYVSLLKPAEAAMPLPLSHDTAVRKIFGHLKDAAVAKRPRPVVQLLGRDEASKQLVAWHVAERMGWTLYRLPAELLPTQTTELETFTRLWQRESALLSVGVYVDASELSPSGTPEGPAAALSRFLSRRGPVFLDTREAWPAEGQQSIALDIARPTGREQQELWTAALGPQAGDIPARLAAQFNLSLRTIQQVSQAAQVAQVEPERGDGPRIDRLWSACLLHTRPRLDVLAQRLDARVEWDALVVPDRERRLLEQIVGQVEQRSTVYEDWGFAAQSDRGLGITVLFTGESGTGKTLAAEVLASRLRLNLYRIDLSAVVSKYIGETEKNLRRLFDAAEDGGAILFFDEADALFGKRSEVKDSHDRYANIEINYLLQRMEAYRGLAILATNVKSALDTAFLRRLRFIVQFPFPGPTERRLIWERVFPPDTPVDGLDFDWLGRRLDLTGGSIKNVAVNAAFLAARAETPVTMPLVLDAARTELEKLSRPLKEADFLWKAPAEVLR